jgi:hypothetical protein
MTHDHRPRKRGNTVKAPLTPKVPVENGEYAAFTRRVLRAYARRIASGDIDALTSITALGTEVENAIRQSVIGLRESGYSWADIGLRLGVTRQAAQQRWGDTQP